MKTFEYRGYTEAGHAAKGMVQAFDLKDARERLSRQGVLTRTIQPAGTKRGSRSRKRLFDANTRSLIYREMAALIKAGLPLDQAFDILIDTPELGRNTGILAGVRDAIREGASLATAMGDAHPQVTDFERAMIEVGETTGKLHASIDHLAAFLEEDQVVREKVQTALVYPLVVLTLAAIAMIILVTVMFPAFSKVLLSMDVELPWVTRMMMGAGQLMNGPGLLVLPIAAIGIAWMFRRARTHEGSRAKWDQRMFRWPVAGRIYTSLVNLRFARTLSLMLEGGIPVTESVALAGKATGSLWVGQLAAAQAETIRHGGSLADAVSAIPPLSETLPGWIRAGEASGEVPGLLLNAARRYQQAWERSIARMLSLMEPVIILVVGLFVLMIALAVLLPLLTLNKAIL
ncbi:MAG: general secretion pathway protein F [Kiritimatiellia bacterium]|jgi:general secretion pathway protein F